MNYNKNNIQEPDNNNYRKLAASIHDKPVPPKLQEHTWNRIEENRRTVKARKRKHISRFSYYSIAGTAAVVVLTIMLFAPVTIKTDYYPVAEKKGKGPTASINYILGQDPGVDKILEYCDGLDADIVSIVYLEDSPKVASLIFKLSVNNYKTFREVYNNATIGFLPESARRLKAGKVRVQIYFPGRKFFIGDFNGDANDDFGSCFIKDRKISLFYISLNNTLGGFEEPIAFSPANNLLLSRKDEICSGDINGDGFSDLIIKHVGIKGQSAEFVAYLNMQELKFTKTPWIFPEIIGSPVQDIFCSDFNNDKLDDLAVYNYRGPLAGKFLVALNKGSRQFTEPTELITGLSMPDSTIKHKAVVMDLNGDGFSDTGIYWQMGEKNAYWYFSNTGKGLTGGPEYIAQFGSGNMAFMGNYMVYTGDTNNDGYDELLVKAGTNDEVSFWYHMLNLKEGNFFSDGSIDFNGKEDIIVSHDKQ